MNQILGCNSFHLVSQAFAVANLCFSISVCDCGVLMVEDNRMGLQISLILETKSTHCFNYSLINVEFCFVAWVSVHDLCSFYANSCFSVVKVRISLVVVKVLEFQSLVTSLLLSVQLFKNEAELKTCF